MEQQTLDISWSAIFKIFIVVVSTYVVFVIKDILAWFVFALMLGILFNFAIDFFEKKRIPRLVSALVLYLGFFVLIGFFIFKTAPIFLDEFKDFAGNFPSYLQKVSPIFEKLGIHSFSSTETLVNAIQAELEPAGNSFFGALFSMFGGASATLLVLVLAFFISLEKQFLVKVLGVFTPENKKEYVLHLWKRARKKVSGWFITRVIGVVFVGAATFLVLSILNVRYALLLSILAGALDILPIVGPMIAGAVIVIIVALTSPLQALFAAVAFVMIQQLENHLVFPILFKKLIGLSPVLVLIAVAVGGKLWGPAGAILGIPLAGVLYEILKDYLIKLKGEPLVSHQ